MRGIILIPVVCILTSCIYVEGQIIKEPEDVVVPPQVYQFNADDLCQNMDVSQPQRVAHCGN